MLQSLTPLSCMGTGPPPSSRPGVFAVGVFDEPPPSRDRAKKNEKKQKEEEKRFLTLREQGKVRLQKTPELLANLPELATAGTYILVRRLMCCACCSNMSFHMEQCVGCR